MNDESDSSPNKQPAPRSRTSRPRRRPSPDGEVLFAVNSLASTSHTVRIKARSSGDLADVLVAGQRFGPLSVSDLATLGLADGCAWNEDLKARVELAVRRRACLRKAMSLLSARPRSEREVLDRLAAAGFEPSICDATLLTLRVQGLLNDAALSESIIENACHRGDAQPSVSQALQRRGVSADSHSISQMPQATDESAATEVARALFERQSRAGNRLETPANALKRRRQIYAALLRRGFDEDTADRAAATAVGPVAEDATEFSD